MISFVDLKREYAEISAEVSQAIQRVLKSGYFILNEEVEKFEKEFSEYVGVKYGISVNSGSNALFLLCLKPLNNKINEIITIFHIFSNNINGNFLVLRFPNKDKRR